MTQVELESWRGTRLVRLEKQSCWLKAELLADEQEFIFGASDCQFMYLANQELKNLTWVTALQEEQNEPRKI